MVVRSAGGGRRVKVWCAQAGAKGRQVRQAARRRRCASSKVVVSGVSCRWQVVASPASEVRGGRQVRGRVVCAAGPGVCGSVAVVQRVAAAGPRPAQWWQVCGRGR